MSEDIRVTMGKDDIDSLLNECAQGFSGAELQEIDGVRLVWPNGWLLVRRSITEPKVTIRLEGESGSDLRQIAADFSDRFPRLRAEVDAALAKFAG